VCTCVLSLRCVLTIAAVIWHDGKDVLDSAKAADSLPRSQGHILSHVLVSAIDHRALHCRAGVGPVNLEADRRLGCANLIATSHFVDDV